MRISDWSSDVCSSDLAKGQARRLVAGCMVGVIEAEPKGYGLVSAVANIRNLRGRHKLLAHAHAPPRIRAPKPKPSAARSEEHTSELQSLMRISYAVFCLKKKNNNT